MSDMKTPKCLEGAIRQYSNFNDAVAARKMAELEHGFHPNHGRAV